MILTSSQALGVADMAHQIHNVSESGSVLELRLGKIRIDYNPNRRVTAKMVVTTIDSEESYMSLDEFEVAYGIDDESIFGEGN